MADRAREYSGYTFKGYYRVTYGDPLSPMLLNVVVDDVIHSWVMVAESTEEGTDGIGLFIQDLEE